MKLQAHSIALRLHGSAILNNVDFTIDAGEFIGLIGPNGAGKTSLLRVLANLQQPNSGELTLDGVALCDIHRKQLAQTIGYLAQGAPAHWPLQVRRLVELGRAPYLSPWGKLSAHDKIIVEQAMAHAEVLHLAERTVTTLSGGERLRVLLARLFATEPNIILADEPIASLDPYHQLHAMELLRDHCARGGSAVVVMHDLNMAARFCHRLVLLHQGEVISTGSPAQVLAPQQLADIYGIEVNLMTSAAGLSVLPRARIKAQQNDPEQKQTIRTT